MEPLCYGASAASSSQTQEDFSRHSREKLAITERQCDILFTLPRLTCAILGTIKTTANAYARSHGTPPHPQPL